MLLFLLSFHESSKLLFPCPSPPIKTKYSSLLARIVLSLKSQNQLFFDPPHASQIPPWTKVTRVSFLTGPVKLICTLGREALSRAGSQWVLSQKSDPCFSTFF